MKHKKLTIALVASMVATILMVATLSVYAYFTTRVYVYTEDGKEVAHVGMNLQLLFGKLSGVTEGTDLKIPSYNVVDANGTIVTVTENNATYWANTAGTGQYLHYNDGVNDKTTYGPDAPWGSAQNPYVISETRHLQNLSALQSVGYFDLLYVANNFDANGNYIPGSASIPYFLICTDTTSTTTGAVAGHPVTIDGSALDSPIKPIGSAEHPFIGVIGGAFNTADSPTTTVAGKTSSVSTVHGFKIQTNTNQTDVGLFGYVGFLGKEPTAAELAESMKVSTYVPAFEGVFSSIQNMLISDVSVTVASPNLGEKISALFEPFWKTFFAGANQPKDEDGNIILHRFTFSDMTVGDASTFHETHHIGIFAGHVSYAMIDQINVYYSNETTHAIDVTGTSADDNYYSASGILGMMYNMNCTVENQTDGNCRVLLGTGTSGDEVGSGSGTGTGGGALSGNGRGYVTAAEIFSVFNNVAVNEDANNELLWRYRITNDGDWSTGILIFEKTDAETNTTTYTLADGKTAVTLSADKKTVSVPGTEKSWTKFFVRRLTQTNDGEKFSYFAYTTEGTESVIYDCELLGNKDNGQTIWKFSAGGDGIWHYGIRILQTGEGESATYKLENNVVVTFNDTTKAMETSDGKSWKNFFITTADGAGRMYDHLTGEYWSVSSYERKPMTLIEAYRTGTDEAGNPVDYLLCEEWQAPTALGSMPSGSYYFYDGVFTFGLSSPDDTVRDTWKNEQNPILHLGARDPDAWGIDTDRGNRTLVALLTPVTSNKQLDLAIAEGKQFYIAAQPTDSTAYLMSLITENIKGTETKTTQSGRDYITETIQIDVPGNVINTSVSLENNLRNQLLEYYQNGSYTQLPMAPAVGQTDQVMSMEVVDENGDLDRVDVTLAAMQQATFWNKYTVLNVGRTSDSVSLEELKKQYNIVASNVGTKDADGNIVNKYYYYMDGTNTYVGSATGNATLQLSQYRTYDSYIYYTVSHVATAWSTGQYSGTQYERTRVYTFTFFYQPPNNAAPVSLGSTTVTVNGASTGGGTYRMADFTYGQVNFGQEEERVSEESGRNTYYLGQNNANLNRFDPRVFYTRQYVDGQNYTGMTTTNQLNSGVSIVPVVTTGTSGTGNNRYTTYTHTTDTDGERMFTLTYDGQTIENLPMINMTANRFQGSLVETETDATPAILSEGHASKKLTGNTSTQYYYYDVATELFYVAGSNTPIEKGTRTDAEYAAYVKAQYPNRTRLNRYPAYEFSDNSDSEIRSYLQFLHLYSSKNYWYGKTGDKYQLWAGRSDQYEALYLKKVKANDVSYTTEGVLIFENGSCYIQYTYDKTDMPDWEKGDGYGAGQNSAVTYTDHLLTRYVGYTYDTTNKTVGYELSTTKMQLYVYIIEGVIDTSYGVNTFVPNESAMDGDETFIEPESFFADDVVLWPQTSLKQDGVYTNNGKTEFDTGDDAENASMTKTEDPVYKVIPLIGDNGLNWGTATGYKLGEDGKFGLDKKFQMADQSTFGKLNISGGNVSWVSNPNLMFAPVGSNGVETIIPKGCVAFKVESGGSQTIRIIVAVPTSEFHLDEANFDLDMANDYYVGLWQMPDIDTEADGDQYISFEKSAVLEKFELPRSYSYSFDHSPTSIENGQHYVNVVYNEQEYRTYLNGDTFLVAYEFTVEGNGVYVIGSVHGADDQASTTDVPMEIVHFSVSGTASAGRDGVTGNQLGAIDFVYDDTQGNIATIDKNGSQTGPTNGTEYYSNYYASQCLLYSNNEQKDSSGNYLLLNKEKVWIRRYVDNSTPNSAKTIMAYQVKGDVPDSFLVKQYAINSDTVEKNE